MWCGMVRREWRRQNPFWEGRKRDDACIREQLVRFFLFISVHPDRLNAGEKKRCELPSWWNQHQRKKFEARARGDDWRYSSSSSPWKHNWCWLTLSILSWGRAKEETTGIRLYVVVVVVVVVELKNGEKKKKKKDGEIRELVTLLRYRGMAFPFSSFFFFLF